MKKAAIILFIVLFGITFVVCNAMAASTRDGKRKFKKYCLKKCHNGEEADIIDPTHMTIAQWKAFFKNNAEGLKEAHPNGELKKIKKLKAKHYKSIEKFLTKHAADSEQPETCG